jgi:hypothetical protein
MTRKSDGYTNPTWFNAALREASFILEDILWETHNESDEYAPIVRAIDALQDADLALERAAARGSAA